MKSVVLCALALVVVAAAHISEEEDVLVLNKSNFDEALEAHPNILVEFCEYYNTSPPLLSSFFKGSNHVTILFLLSVYLTTRQFSVDTSVIMHALCLHKYIQPDVITLFTCSGV